MSWLYGGSTDAERFPNPWYHRMIQYVLKYGSIPNHIAFIMDGNRRFARLREMEKTKGHSAGFDKLAEILHWCSKLGVHEVTVYAFSIENFKRASDEVEFLMQLAVEKLEKLIKEKDNLKRENICIRFIGDLSLLPAEVQRIVARISLDTENNTGSILNVCLAYTAREEMSRAVLEIGRGLQSGELDESDLSDQLMQQCLYTHQSSPLDLLIRTSGEWRLSDFLLYQCSTQNTLIDFIEPLWPEVNIWNLYGSILRYQYQVNCGKRPDQISSVNEQSARMTKFLSDLEDRRLDSMKKASVT